MKKGWALGCCPWTGLQQAIRQTACMSARAAHLEQGDHNGMGSFAELEEGAQTCRGAAQEGFVHVSMQRDVCVSTTVSKSVCTGGSSDGNM